MQRLTLRAPDVPRLGEGRWPGPVVRQRVSGFLLGKLGQVRWEQFTMTSGVFFFFFFFWGGGRGGFDCDM